MQPQDFYTRAISNDGARVYLLDKWGATTSEWILVRGLDSDEYRRAQDAFNRVVARLITAVRKGGVAAELPDETVAEKEEAELRSRVALVAAWSLDAPCTNETISELLREAPVIRDQIYAFACERDNFFGKSSQTSISGLTTSSVSIAPQP
jgi:hypothetical protein